MKKTMIVAALLAVAAVTANAQNRDFDQSYQRQTPNQQPNQYTNEQPYPNQYPNTLPQIGRCEVLNPVDAQLQNMQFQLENGIQRGQITQFEAKSLWRNLEFIKEKKYRFERNGFLNRFESQEILADLQDLNAQILHEKFDGERYGQNYGGFRNYGDGNFRGGWGGRRGGDFGERERRRF